MLRKNRSGDKIRKLATSLLVACLVLTIFFVLPVSGENNDQIENSNSTRGRSGNILDVGAGQTYITIQAAIDDSAPGDTISVHAGTYNENVIVDKTLTLTGNGASNTIIDGRGSSDVVYVSADWVNISGFYINNSGDQYNDAGLELNNVQNCTIENNFITLNNKYGILVKSSNNNIIVNNNVSSNVNHGIHLSSSSDNTIDNNIAVSNRAGISVRDHGGNTISNNILASNRMAGIFLETPLGNTIIDNTCDTNYNGRGIYL
ncbi:MAG: right-handed parallel beta-helix repeat-containing protein, partial [Thermoplasmata archaeon]|nr:right-handed parallel beta-helix repeat-containing protein [Thermoplasmata archaeon]